MVPRTYSAVPSGAYVTSSTYGVPQNTFYSGYNVAPQVEYFSAPHSVGYTGSYNIPQSTFYSGSYVSPQYIVPTHYKTYVKPEPVVNVVPITYKAAAVAAVEPGYVAKTPGSVHKADLPAGLGFASHHINLQPAPGTV